MFANAQNWAPIGAKWTYTETFYMTSSQDTLTIRSIGDTVIQTHHCKVFVSFPIIRPFKNRI